MIKLIRNTFGEKKIKKENNEIKWDYLIRLHDLQQKEGLRAGNKITIRHIKFKLLMLTVWQQPNFVKCKITT